MDLVGQLLAGIPPECLNWDSIKQSAIEGAVQAALSGALGGGPIADFVTGVGFDMIVHGASAQDALTNGVMNMVVGAGIDFALSGGNINKFADRTMEGLANDVNFFKGVGKVGKSLGKGLSQGIKGTARAVRNAFTDSAEDAFARAARNVDLDYNGRVRTSGRSGADFGDSLDARRTWYADDNSRPDLSKIEKRLEQVFTNKSTSVTSGNCHKCANLTGSLLQKQGFDVDIVKLQNKPDPFTGRRSPWMHIKDPSNPKKLIQVAETGWHEVARIQLEDGQEYFMDAVAYVHKGVMPLAWGEYADLWAYPDFIESVSSRAVP